jgi:hypothetical protein
MRIQKQEFYEGAALHRLARNGGIKSLRYESPLFVVNGGVLVLLKYSTRGRSPWGFTFTGDEQALMKEKAAGSRLVVGLICGADGVVAFHYQDLISVAAHKKYSLHVACYRQHGEHYAVKGPDGVLDGKVPPSNWPRILQL